MSRKRLFFYCRKSATNCNKRCNKTLKTKSSLQSRCNNCNELQPLKMRLVAVYKSRKSLILQGLLQPTATTATTATTKTRNTYGLGEIGYFYNSIGYIRKTVCSCCSCCSCCTPTKSTQKAPSARMIQNDTQNRRTSAKMIRNDTRLLFIIRDEG